MLGAAVTDTQLSFIQRLGIALRAFALALSDPAFARRLSQTEAAEAQPEVQALPAPKAPERDFRPALQALGALQREGRLVDFVQQDIATFSDADVGTAARVVHEGCRRALQNMVRLTFVLDGAEGQGVSVPSGYDAHAIRLTGNVRGEAPFRGTLRHAGWRAESITLPEVLDDHDCRVLAPAEVEL